LEPTLHKVTVMHIPLMNSPSEYHQLYMLSQSVFKKLVGSAMGTNCAVYGQLTSNCLLGVIVLYVFIKSLFSFYFPFKWLLLRSFVDDVGSSNSLHVSSQRLDSAKCLK
jgi:hypothetical protein